MGLLHFHFLKPSLSLVLFSTTRDILADPPFSHFQFGFTFTSRLDPAQHRGKLLPAPGYTLCRYKCKYKYKYRYKYKYKYKDKYKYNSPPDWILPSTGVSSCQQRVDTSTNTNTGENTNTNTNTGTNTNTNKETNTNTV